MDIKGSKFLITGGSSGIGKALAELLKSEGAEVAITGRDKTKLDFVAKELGVLGIHADVACEEDIDKTFQVIFKEWDGQLDGLINNAGIGFRTSLEELSREKFLEIYNVNVFGAALMAQQAAEIFRKQKSGNIINIGSTSALKGYKNGSIYSSSKFALKSLTECWAAELRPYNVRVTLVNPSTVTTAFANEDRVEQNEVDNLMRSQDIAQGILGVLRLDNRAFVTEMTLFATNPF